MNKDVEQALFDHVATKPDMSVDDMLWWLHDKYKLVVGTRTIRRAFERRNTSHKKFRQNVRKELRASRDASASLGATADVSGDHSHLSHADNTYQSPYAPMANMGNNTSVSDISPELAHALGGLAQTNDNIHPDLVGDNVELSEDEETMQLQLQQIALERREIELKLRMRRMQKARQSSQTPRMLTDAHDQSFFTDLTSTPDVPGAHPPTDNTVPNEMSPTANPNPKPRDSRSKSKVEEAKKRTEERQERMLKDLEKRSRRREHLTAEWVQVSRSFKNDMNNVTNTHDPRAGTSGRRALRNFLSISCTSTQLTPTIKTRWRRLKPSFANFTNSLTMKTGTARCTTIFYVSGHVAR